MESKKISFGFMKTKKAEKAPIEEKKEFIECVEEKSIKIVGGETVEDNTPLVIPMKPNTLVTAERLKQIAVKVESALEEPEVKEEPKSPVNIPPENESLDQMAVRELLEDSKKTVKVETEELTVPVPSKPIMSGEKESTLEDYESVPIQDFGMAMLRGMGWKPNKDQSKYKQPQLRPKGLGLGADKVISENEKKNSSKTNKEEDLSIVKNSFVKITNGKHSGYYGKVVSLDEDNGRVMVDITVKKETVSLSEFMMHPVTKAEFDKESKVINADTFDEYKRNEKLPQNSKNSERDKPSKSSNPSKSDKDEEIRKRSDKDEKEYDKSSNGKSSNRVRSRKNSTSSEDRSRRRKKDKKRYSSNESISSISDSERRRRKKKERRRRSSSSSVSSDSDYRKSKKRTEGKRDIDKKRKGKKKKRDRDRSPNYRKYKK